MRALRMAIGAAVPLALAAACVDLFHGTDFVTLCTADPSACTDAGDAAVEAAPPPPLVTEYCGWSAPEARAHAERACAWLGACGGVVDETKLGACMLRALAAYDCRINPSLRPRGATNALWACLAVVDSCAKVESCLFGSAPETCSPRDAGTFTRCGAGTNVVACGRSTPSPTVIEPCLLEGRSCVSVDDATSICAGKQGIQCSSASRCDGTHAVECKITTIGTDVGVDCAAYGSGQCLEQDGGGGAACAPLDDAGPCTGTSRPTCDDAGVARSCVGGREVAFDCTQLGSGCRVEPALATSNPLGACVNTSADAAARCSGPDTCDGDILRSCGQGTAFEVNCKNLGLGPCAIPPDRGPVAACSRPR